MGMSQRERAALRRLVRDDFELARRRLTRLAAEHNEAISRDSDQEAKRRLREARRKLRALKRRADRLEASARELAEELQDAGVRWPGGRRRDYGALLEVELVREESLSSAAVDEASNEARRELAVKARKAQEALDTQEQGLLRRLTLGELEGDEAQAFVELIPDPATLLGERPPLELLPAEELAG